jgi:hypothetical protein
MFWRDRSKHRSYRRTVTVRVERSKPGRPRHISALFKHIRDIINRYQPGCACGNRHLPGAACEHSFDSNFAGTPVRFFEQHVSNLTETTHLIDD